MLFYFKLNYKQINFNFKDINESKFSLHTHILYLITNKILLKILFNLYPINYFFKFQIIFKNYKIHQRI